MYNSLIARCKEKLAVTGGQYRRSLPDNLRASHEIVTATTSPFLDRHHPIGTAWAPRATPRHPAELGEHECLRYSLLTTPEIWRFTNAKGEETAVRPHGRLRANNSDVMLHSLRAGHGIAVVPDFIIDTDLASGAVVPILEEWKPQPVALHLVTPPGTIRSARVTAFIEYLALRLGPTTGT
jgi:DNA-binding transcriptional LysR family regulator